MTCAIEEWRAEHTRLTNIRDEALSLLADITHRPKYEFCEDDDEDAIWDRFRHAFRMLPKIPQCNCDKCIHRKVMEKLEGDHDLQL